MEQEFKTPKISTEKINPNELSPEAQEAIKQAEELKVEINNIEQSIKEGDEHGFKDSAMSLLKKIKLTVPLFMALLPIKKMTATEISGHPGNPVKTTKGVEKPEEGKKEKADDMKVLSREEFYKKEMREGLNKNPKTVEEIEQNLDKGESVIGFKEKDGNLILVVGNFEDRVKEGGDAIPFDKREKVKTGVSELTLINRNDMGTIAMIENTGGKYALQVEVKGNTIVYKYNRNEKISNEDIKKILDLGNYNEDTLKKIADQVHVKVYDVDGNLVGQTTFNLLH